MFDSKGSIGGIRLFRKDDTEVCAKCKGDLKLVNENVIGLIVIKTYYCPRCVRYQRKVIGLVHVLA